MKPRPCLVPLCNSPASQLIDVVSLCGVHAISVHMQVLERRKQATPTRRQPKAAVSARARPLAKTRQGVVYFARFGDLIKIGFSSNVQQRMNALKPDELLGVIPGVMDDEKSLHARFGPWREHGEYFRPNPELLALISSLGSGNGAA